MGAVYRATDTKLSREVAIKVLPEAFSGDADRLARFTREAQVLAGLNHPNIAAVYAIEDGAIVMELVEGPTLAEQMASGAVPLHDALLIARQIAEALEVAHEKNVIHRDLKPANIKVTADGTVKVLDFGLAKLVDPRQPAENPELAPTVVKGNSPTMAGMIMGTAEYMSPEQAAGKPVDRRSDIWSFGVVLYEMLTGRGLFRGETITHTLADVLRAPVDFSNLPSETPPAVRALIARCVERDVRERLRDIGEARILIQRQLSSPALPAHTGKRHPALAWILCATLGAAALTLGIAWLRSSRSGPVPVYRYTLDSSSAGLSPDGRWFMTTSRLGIRLRPVDQVEWRTLPGTEGAGAAFWSSDGSAIAFFAANRLKIVTTDGSKLRDLAAAPGEAGGTWKGSFADGTLFFSSEGKLWRLELGKNSVGEVPLAVPPGHYVARPTLTPTGDSLLLEIGTAGTTSLFVSSLEGGAPVKRFDAARHASFARHPHSGEWHIFFVVDDPHADGVTLMTAPVHPETAVVRTAPVKLLTQLFEFPQSSTRSGFIRFQAASSGLMIWGRAIAALPIWTIRWHERDGRPVSTVAPPGNHFDVALSPDETKVAVTTGYPRTDIWVYSPATGESTRVSTEVGSKFTPLWAKDGRYLFYHVRNGQSSKIVRREASGAENSIVLLDREGYTQLQDVTPDGQHLIVSTGKGLFQLPTDAISSQGNLQPLVAVPVATPPPNSARVIRGGRWLMADSGSETLAWKYPPHNQAPLRINTQLPRTPFYDADGHTVLGRENGPDGKVYLTSRVIEEAGDGGIRLGPPRVLFAANMPTRASARVGAASRDGKRILLISTDETEPLRMQVISDWTALLQSSVAK